MALSGLQKIGNCGDAKRNIRAATQKVASRLGNTPAVCGKCYVHPEIISTYIEGSPLLRGEAKVGDELRRDIAALFPEEAAVLSLLRTRLARTQKDKPESITAS
jgi:DNA topoisomerase-1